MNGIEILGLNISMWLAMPLLYIIWVAILLTIKRVTWITVRRAAKKTKTRLDDVFLQTADLPVKILIFASGAFIFARLFPDAKIWMDAAFKGLTIFALILFADRFTNRLLNEYSPRVSILASSGGVIHAFVRVVVCVLGGLIFLDSFGISITPIIASLGIGSLAIALALQPTLESLFAGIQIATDQPIRLGDFVKLESGEEGYVQKIGWRSTWVRLLSNYMVIIPNKSLVNARIINYYYPDKEIAVVVNIGVHYQSDLEKVERVTTEVARETLKSVPGAVATFEPFIRYHTLGDFDIKFSVILRVKEFVDNYLLRHEFIKNLHKRYAKEGIVIPYPVQAVNHTQEESFNSPEGKDERKDSGHVHHR